jgi:hypothetical protein
VFHVSTLRHGEEQSGSRVRISSDGQRLLIEPVREEKQITPLELVDAARVVEILVSWGIGAERIHRLNPRLEKSAGATWDAAVEAALSCA